MKLKSSPIPLYYQLETIFRNKIASGEWAVGSKIPNEIELARNYGVSVMTIKQALSILVEEGIISRKRGIGTYVEEEAKGDMLHPLEGSFKQAIGGIMASTAMKVLDYNTITPPKHIADKLKITIDNNILSFKRLYFFNSSSPFCLTVHYLKQEIGQYLSKEELKKEPVTVLIDQKSPMRVGSAKQIMRASIADDYLSKLFEVNIGFPILKVERTVYSIKKEPLQYVDIFYRADKYVFRAELKFNKD